MESPNVEEVAALITSVSSEMIGRTFEPHTGELGRSDKRWCGAFIEIREPATLVCVIASDLAGCRAITAEVFGCVLEDVDDEMIGDEIQTDETGRFQLQVTGEEPVSLSVSAAGCVTEDIDIETPATEDVAIVLAQARVVEGIVRGHDGKPAACRVRGRGHWLDAQTTDGAGWFRLTGVRAGPLG